ncbi:MAG: glycosyltransferase [Armatimonadetes bacterium]|nr:glycosyltransferase [Armatimonadota bacterium]
MPIRVLVAAHTNVSHLCAGLAGHGLEVAGIQPRRIDLGEFGGLREGQQAESEFPVLAPPVFPVRPYVYSVYLTGVLRFLRHFHPDVAFLAGEPSELGMAQVARLAHRAAPEVRIVFYSLENLLLDWRGFPRRLRGWALRSSLAQAHLMAAASTGVTDVLVRQGFPADRVRLLYPGVRADRFQPRDPTPVREALGLAPDAFHIGYVGRLVPEKGLDLLLKALQGLPPDCHLTIVGDGPEATSLASLVSHLGLTPRVRWPGRVAHEQLAPYMSAFDVLVLPSRTLPRWAEQYGQVLVEAMLCETPVVGSTCGAIPEIIGETGLVFPEGEVPALRETLESLRGDHRLRQSLAAAGRARAEKQFTDVVFFRSLTDILREAGED